MMRLRYWTGPAIVGIALTLLAPSMEVWAAVPSLKINPLKYETTFTGPDSKIGYIDVSNPSDTFIKIATSVQGFRQVGSSGDLQFFDDAKMVSAVTVGATTFMLDPHEAVRVPFQINPAPLGKGGSYGAIFFQTIPAHTHTSGAAIAMSARVGTLLLINNGTGDKQAAWRHLSVPFFQVGNGLNGNLTIANVGRAPAVAFNPTVGSQIWPWGHTSFQDGSLVLPGAERTTSWSKNGSYLGLLPLHLSLSQGGDSRTIWILAVTGWWRWAFPCLLAVLVILLLAWRRRPQK